MAAPEISGRQNTDCSIAYAAEYLDNIGKQAEADRLLKEAASGRPALTRLLDGQVAVTARPDDNIEKSFPAGSPWQDGGHDPEPTPGSFLEIDQK